MIGHTIPHITLISLLHLLRASASSLFTFRLFVSFQLLLPCSQGDHLYGKPGNVGEFDSCQGNVRDFNKSQGSVREKILSGKSGLKLFIVSCIFAYLFVCF